MQVILKMRSIFAAILTLTLATQAVAGETVMVCNANGYESRYYKLVKPLLGPSKVKQKIDSKWVDWCRKHPDTPDYRCDLEVYSSGAKLNGYQPWVAKKDDISVGVKKGDNIRLERTLLIDFEFGKRSISVRFYMNNKSSDIMSWRIDDKYSCEIQ